MAENQFEELFRTAKKGGYEKADVDLKIKAMQASAASEKEAFLAQIAEKDNEIGELNAKISEQSNELDGLHRDISEKYQTYIDHYDTIGEIILESRVQAKKILEDAYAERDRIMAGVQEEAQKAAEEARKNAIVDALREKEEIEKQTAAKREEYNAICARIDALLKSVDAANSDFYEAVKTVHGIAQGNPPAVTCSEESSEDFDIADTHEIEFEGFSEEE